MVMCPMPYALSCDQRSVHYMFEVEVEVSGIQKTRRVLVGEFLPVGFWYVSRPNFLVQLAMQFGFFVVLLEKNWVRMLSNFFSNGIRVSLNENSSGRGYASIIGPLQPGPQRAADGKFQLVLYI